MRKRRGDDESDEDDARQNDPEAELYRVDTKLKLEKTKATVKGEEGNVTNSAKMLTAIPEVDLGMEYVRFGEQSSRLTCSVHGCGTSRTRRWQNDM